MGQSNDGPAKFEYLKMKDHKWADKTAKAVVKKIDNMKRSRCSLQ